MLLGGGEPLLDADAASLLLLLLLLLRMPPLSVDDGIELVVIVLRLLFENVAFSSSSCIIVTIYMQLVE